MKNKLKRVKSLLGINTETDKEDMSERHREIIEEIEGKEKE